MTLAIYSSSHFRVFTVFGLSFENDVRLKFSLKFQGWFVTVQLSMFMLSCYILFSSNFCSLAYCSIFVNHFFHFFIHIFSYELNYKNYNLKNERRKRDLNPRAA